MAATVLIQDACVLINLTATGRFEQIARGIGVSRDVEPLAGLNIRERYPPPIICNDSVHHALAWSWPAASEKFSVMHSGGPNAVPICRTILPGIMTSEHRSGNNTWRMRRTCRRCRRIIRRNRFFIPLPSHSSAISFSIFLSLIFLSFVLNASHNRNMGQMRREQIAP
jgi:hypothetical protein